MAQYQHVFFEPWIGSKYYTDGLWGKKVLIVGESHYDEFFSNKSDAASGMSKPKHTLGRDWTQYCIQAIVSGEKGPAFWTSLRNRVGGAEHEEAPAAAFWPRVAYYNFVQTPVGGAARVAPTKEQFKNSMAAFEEVLEKLNPDRVIVTGDRMHPYIPSRVGKWPDLMGEDEYTKIPIEYFVDCGGKKIYITMTSHPTSSYFYKTLAVLFQEFIATDWDNYECEYWIADLKIRTRKALSGLDVLTSLTSHLHLKHHSKGYATMENSAIENGFYLLKNKKTNAETSYKDADSVIAAGWVID
ncbi:hypothetical protein [Methylobacterium planeticum]|uniref:Uncharacterized protein n=1 Tax=Methylobacterium planeticum TaxID=2615211 RepID=A0A6N6MQ66_9HYPH|nr:hypothetical protein [Methylobacterium planeticum]KAB1071519.1 hypothetical protein F6X51_19620 [Methylobacterium planeticum]